MISPRQEVENYVGEKEISYVGNNIPDPIMNFDEIILPDYVFNEVKWVFMWSVFII